MNKQNTYLRYSIITIVILLAAYFGIVTYAENKIKAYISNSTVFEVKQYKKLDFSLLSGGLDLFDVHLENKNQRIMSHALKISDISYYDFLIHNKITINRIAIDNLDLVYDLTNTPQNPNQPKGSFQEDVTIKEFELKARRVVLLKKSDTIIKTDSLFTTFSNIHISNKTLQKSIPFTYDAFELSLHNIQTAMNPVHKLHIKQLEANQNNIQIDSLSIIPLFSKKDYIHQFQYQNDRYDCTIASLELQDYSIKETDSVFLTAKKLAVQHADFGIYLDATTKTKENKIKPLYSKKLRNLPFNLHIAEANIKHANITYEELVNPKRPPGLVAFKDLNATIQNITNNSTFNKNTPNTTIEVSTKFMGTTPLNVSWYFDVNDRNDQFYIKGGMENIPESSLSTFTEPALGVRFKGTIDKLYFNFSGNNIEGGGDYLLTYDTLDVVLLDKKQEKKGVLGWLANIFINSKNKKKKGKITIKEVKRDQISSFWNFFWLMNKEGLTATLL